MKTFTLSSCSITFRHFSDLNPPVISALIFVLWPAPKLDLKTAPEDSLIHISARLESAEEWNMTEGNTNSKTLCFGDKLPLYVLQYAIYMARRSQLQMDNYM